MISRMRFAHGAFLATILTAACSVDSEQGELALPLSCQPLFGPRECRAPFPSDFFRIADSSTPTGYRISLEGVADLTTPAKGKAASIYKRMKIDGASIVPTIVAALPGVVVNDGLPKVQDDPAKSQQKTSATVIIDADTGAFIPHYTDVIGDAGETLSAPIVLRTIVPLKPKTRYVVAFTGIQQEGGGLARAGDGFIKLRDKTASEKGLKRVESHYENDIFPVLQKAGIARQGLQLAWDFTTGSLESVRHDTLRVRELTLAWLKTHTPKVTITAVEPSTDAAVWKLVRGTIEGPNYLASPDEIRTRLKRDAKGELIENGVVQTPFVVNIPISVKNSFGPGRAVAMGHGFFGSRDEVSYAASKPIANGLHAALFSVDWLGMAESDALAVASQISDEAASIDFLPDKVVQAMSNWLVTTRAILGPMKDVAELKRPLTGGDADGVHIENGVSNAGALVFDGSKDKVAYFGASQGHIMGSIMCALNPDISRAVMNVGGGGYTHMMARARPFITFGKIIDEAFGRDSMKSQLYIATTQNVLDRVDAVNFADLLIGSKLPGNPERRILMQIGLGDSSVPNLGSFLHARALGLSQIAPAPIEPWGIPTATAESLTSGLTLFDYGVDLSGYNKVGAQADNPVHTSVRQDPNALKQMTEFYEGKLVHPCSGPCKGVPTP